MRREERELFVRFDALVADETVSGPVGPIVAILDARPARACALPDTGRT